jgi:hypothetical protein
MKSSSLAECPGHTREVPDVLILLKSFREILRSENPRVVRDTSG